MSDTIHAEMTIPDIVKAHPETKSVFQDFHIHVDGYKAIEHENLSATARVMQIDASKLVKALNAALK